MTNNKFKQNTLIRGGRKWYVVVEGGRRLEEKSEMILFLFIANFDVSKCCTNTKRALLRIKVQVNWGIIKDSVGYQRIVETTVIRRNYLCCG